MKKNVPPIILCMGLVSVSFIMGTLAYLTDTDEVVNTFTVGQIDLVLDEADVDENGKLITDSQGNPVARVQENEYHLIPGRIYTKDPTITIQPESELSYVRMILTIHHASAVQSIIDKYISAN